MGQSLSVRGLHVPWNQEKPKKNMQEAAQSMEASRRPRHLSHTAQRPLNVTGVMDNLVQGLWPG